jgi:uncharacterized cofD-like protein
VVALGGGHGLAVALQAIRRYAGDITAVVSVADDGGSSGRLRRSMNVPAPGDLRKCLVALASDAGIWPEAFEHRFDAGELAGHPLGNLVLVGLHETFGDLSAALDEAGRLLGAVGRVRPATIDPVVLRARVDGRPVEGQVAIEQAAGGPVTDVHLAPADVRACPDALDALARADQIVLAPGSLYTSLVAVLVVPEIRAALARAAGRTVQICNLRSEHETVGLSGTDHLRVVLEHGGRVDVFLYDPDQGLPVDETAVKELDVRPAAGSLATAGGVIHDPGQLARALQALL